MKDWIIKFVVLVLLMSFVSHPLAAEVIYYDTNNVGTPVAMWDSTGGKVWEATYYPFGTEYQTPTNIWENTRKFAGKEKDKETDLSYFGARYYDDLTGRFLTPDPVQPVDALTSKTNAEMLNNPQRLNRYAYGLNNPYKYVDPDGEFPFLVAPLAGAAIAYFSAPDIANAPESSSTHTYESHGVRNIAVGAIACASLTAAPSVVANIGPRIAPLSPAAIKIEETTNRNWKHISKHLPEFQRFDPKMTLEAVEKLGRKIANNSNNFVSSKGGNSNFEQVIKIGKEDVTIRAVLNKNNSLRSVHIRE